MLSTAQQLLIDLLIRESSQAKSGVDAKNFRAKNHELFREIKDLESTRYIHKDNEKYYASIKAIYELKERSIKAKRTWHLLEKVYESLVVIYLKQQESPLTVSTLSKIVDLPEPHISLALQYLLQTHSFRSWTAGFAKGDSLFSIAEEILQNKTLKDAIEINPTASFVDNSNGSASRSSAPHKFIDPYRIDELKAIKTRKYDTARIIRICEEINSNSDKDNFFSVACLSRILIDHIPPIFSHATFNDLANQYNGGKSFKESMLHLEKSMRKISDGLLHQTIRQTESLPTRATVNFSPDIDILLAEATRLLKQMS